MGDFDSSPTDSRMKMFAISEAAAQLADFPVGLY
jgi:hypothetical protein